MNMFKIALAGTALVGSLATAVANNTCSFSGFYAGGQIGVGVTNSHVKANFNISPGNTGRFNEKVAATGLIGGAHVGYGKHFPNRFYFGFEAYGNFSSNKSTQQFSVNSTNGANFNNFVGAIRVKRQNSIGLALRPGMVFGNTLVNLILGAESTKFNYASAYKGQIVNAAGVVQGNPVVGSLSKSKRSYAFVPGLGVSFLANERLVLGLEAKAPMYKNVKPVKGTDLKVKTQVIDVMAKISYKF